MDKLLEKWANEFPVGTKVEHKGVRGLTGTVMNVSDRRDRVVPLHSYKTVFRSNHYHDIIYVAVHWDDQSLTNYGEQIPDNLEIINNPIKFPIKVKAIKESTSIIVGNIYTAIGINKHNNYIISDSEKGERELSKYKFRKCKVEYTILESGEWGYIEV